MLNLRLTLFVTFWISLLSHTYGQQEYIIKFKINGLKDTTCMIGNYYSNGTYIKDTLKVDGSGRCVFKAPADLPKGLYILVITDKNYFDFVISNDKKFTMETEVQDPVEKMVIKDSPDNELFYKYLNFNREKFSIIQDYQKKLKNVSEKKDSADVYSKMITDESKALIAYKLDLVKKHPEAFISLMINAMKEPEIPEIPLLPNGRKDSTFAYHYYKSHFWDDVDFTDDRLIRTPVFYNKLKKYYDNVLIQVPDTIKREVDLMIEKTRPNPEMFKYMIWFTTYRYETSDIMGFDEVFVHIIDKYYVTGQASWIDKGTNEKIIKKANKIRNLLIGTKAPNMVMQDTSFQLVSMHSIQAKYLLVLFWDPECSHCEQDMPKIKAAYDITREKYGLEIFAVCSDTSMFKMKNKIRKNHMTWINVNGPRTLTGDFHDSYDIISTPVIYILNERKEIIAKQLPADKIEEFLGNYVKRNKKE
ncbi:MAG: thioredoxin-like domain-containing protein [Bacteroidota bacterium]